MKRTALLGISIILLIGSVSAVEEFENDSPNIELLTPEDSTGLVEEFDLAVNFHDVEETDIVENQVLGFLAPPDRHPDVIESEEDFEDLRSDLGEISVAYPVFNNEYEVLVEQSGPFETSIELSEVGESLGIMPEEDIGVYIWFVEESGEVAHVEYNEFVLGEEDISEELEDNVRDTTENDVEGPELLEEDVEIDLSEFKQEARENVPDFLVSLGTSIIPEQRINIEFTGEFSEEFQELADAAEEDPIPENASIEVDNNLDEVVIQSESVEDPTIDVEIDLEVIERNFDPDESMDIDDLPELVEEGKIDYDVSGVRNRMFFGVVELVFL